MTPADAPAFLSRLTALAELFDVQLSEAKLQIYFEALCDLSIEDITTGIAESARYSKFMPKPIEIREYGGHDLTATAERKWLEFREAQRREGRYGTWKADETTNEVLITLFGGWHHSCEMELTPEMWQAKKKEFIREYVSEEREYVRYRIEDALKAFPSQKLLNA
jgi:hypothetical protein